MFIVIDSICMCVTVFQGDIEGVDAEPNDRKVSRARRSINSLNQMSPPPTFFSPLTNTH